MLIFNTDSGSIYYEVQGTQSPAVIFTHGGGLNGEMFRDQVEAIKGEYTTVIWDMPGHGRSTPLAGNLDVPQTAECLVDLMDEIGLDIAVLVGQSLGTYVSQHAAVRHPDRVRGIVSIGGLPIDRPMNPLELRAFKVLLAVSRWLPEGLIFRRAAQEKAQTESAQAFFLESMQTMGKEQFLWMLGGQLDACDLSSAAPTQPLLIVNGEHEMPKSLLQANERWHRSVPGSQYFRIPNAGHNGNQDNPEAFNEVLLRFLRNLGRKDERHPTGAVAENATELVNSTR